MHQEGFSSAPLKGGELRGGEDTPELGLQGL